MLEQEQEDAQLTQATHYECNEVRQGYIMSETSSLITIAVNEDGYREVPGAAEGMKEDKASWVSFFQWLKSRGPDGVNLLLEKMYENVKNCGRSIP